jgi:hypothetical protein
MKKIVIGFGTGRSGTTSLSAFMNAQADVYIMHEGRMRPEEQAHIFSWKGAEEDVLAWLEALHSRFDEYSWIGDVGMYYINYIPLILRAYPTAKFVCIERNKDEVVSSYLKWTVDKNHWIEHDGLTWKFDEPWDKAYPKYNVVTKQEALEHYWQDYHKMTRELKGRYPDSVMIVQLDDFNKHATRDALLDFIGYKGIRNINIPVHKNRLTQKQQRGLRRRIIGALIKFKRSLLGRPGNRWYHQLRKSKSRFP